MQRHEAATWGAIPAPVIKSRTIAGEWGIPTLWAVTLAGAGGLAIGLLLFAPLLTAVVNGWSVAWLGMPPLAGIAIALGIFTWRAWAGYEFRRQVQAHEAGIPVLRHDPDGPGPEPRRVQWYFKDPETRKQRMIELESVGDSELYPVAVNALRDGGSLAEERVKPRGMGWRKYRPLVQELGGKGLAEQQGNGWQLTATGLELLRAFVEDYEAEN